jgi:hypothetical protein
MYDISVPPQQQVVPPCVTPQADCAELALVLANPEKYGLKLGVWYMFNADRDIEQHYPAHTLAGHFGISSPALLSALEQAGLAGTGIRHTSLLLPIAKLLPDPQQLPFPRDAGMLVRANDRAALQRMVVAGFYWLARTLNRNIKAVLALLVAGMPLSSKTKAKQRQQRSDHIVVSNIVKSYRDAQERGESKAELRQILSALAPRTGRQGYTLADLRRLHSLLLTAYEWRMTRYHALSAGAGATAEHSVRYQHGISDRRLKELVSFLYSEDNMQQVSRARMLQPIARLLTSRAASRAGDIWHSRAQAVRRGSARHPEHAANPVQSSPLQKVCDGAAKRDGGVLVQQGRDRRLQVRRREPRCVLENLRRIGQGGARAAGRTRPSR